MELIVKKALLYDFYGELLTEHQKSIYSDFILNDIGISEIAAERGISRQGVHEMIKRCDKILADYEEKLHLVDKFLAAKELVTEINTLAGEFHETKDPALVGQIKEISNHILEEF
ncbi:MAG: DNA-binding protein [Lachnospiraceae bacterium]|nr:DNA-binding protein [Lachnospiraceae bacterium]